MLESTLKTMNKGVVLPRADGDVDVRLLTNGMYRYRFWLTAAQLAIVDAAIDLILAETGYLATGAALDVLGTWYLTGQHCAMDLAVTTGSTTRRLFKLYQDQHVNVRGALKLARGYAMTDADGLTLICASYLAAAK